MDCARFEQRFFAGLDTDLEPVEREQLALHEQGCARCRNLAALVAGNAELPAEVAEDFTAAVLMRTSGKVCEQASARLADAADERAGGDELLRLHLASCADCAALERALAQLRRELPTLAEADPGADFVSSVLAATLGHDAPAPARRYPPASTRVGRAGLWQRLASRPRLALEGSYVVTMLALLIFVAPRWSAGDSPVRAFDGWWRDRAEAAHALIESTGESAQRGLDSLWNEIESGDVEPDTTD